MEADTVSLAGADTVSLAGSKLHKKCDGEISISILGDLGGERIAIGGNYGLASSKIAAVGSTAGRVREACLERRVSDIVLGSSSEKRAGSYISLPLMVFHCRDFDFCLGAD